MAQNAKKIKKTNQNENMRPPGRSSYALRRFLWNDATGRTEILATPIKVAKLGRTIIFVIYDKKFVIKISSIVKKYLLKIDHFCLRQLYSDSLDECVKLP